MKSYYTMLVSLILILFLNACGGASNEAKNIDNTSIKDTTQAIETPTNTSKSNNYSANPESPATNTEGSRFSQNNRLIINEWKVKAVLAPGKKDNVMSDQQKAQMKNALIIFRADGSQSMNAELNKEKINEEGRWKLSADGKQVVMISPNGKERRFTIEGISKDKLTLRAVIDHSGIILEAKNAAPVGPFKEN